MANEAAEIPSRGKAKMTVESTPGQPGGFLERLRNLRNLWRKEQVRVSDEQEIPAVLKKQVSRRKFVAATGAAAAGAVALAAFEGQTGELSRTAQSVLGIGEGEKGEPTIFEQIRAKIKNASGDENLRTRLLERLDVYSHVDATLNQIREANEKTFVEADGTPTLVVQTRARLFGSADLKPFWQGKFSSEREFIESQIDILAPLRYQKVLISDYLSELASNSSRDLSSFDDLLKAQVKRTDLPHASSIPPGEKQAVTLPEFDQAFKLIKELGIDVSKHGGIEVKPVKDVPAAGRAAYEQDLQQVLSRNGNLFFPEDVTMLLASPERYKNGALDMHVIEDWGQVGGTVYRDKEGKALVSLRLEGVDYSAVAHEVGHYYMDFVDKFLSGAGAIERRILVEKVLADPAIGRNYPLNELMFDSKRAVPPLGVALSPFDKDVGNIQSGSDFRLATGKYADSVWVTQARVAPLTGERGLFGEILDTKLIEQFAQEGKKQAILMPPSAFLEAEAAKFDELAAVSPAWEYVVGDRRKKPSEFDTWRWINIPGKHGSGIGHLPPSFRSVGEYAQHWRSEVTFAHAKLVERWKAGDPEAGRVVASMSPAVRERFLTMLVNLTNVCDQEKWADTFSVFATHPNLVPKKATSPGVFMGRINELLSPPQTSQPS